MSIVWRRTVDPATLVWVRPDDVVAVGDELVDLATGTTRDEPPWPFLGLQPWSRQRWEPRITAIAEQGPGDGADRVAARRWRDLLVVGRFITDTVRWTDHGLLVEARHVGTGEPAWQHRAGGDKERAAWSDWLGVTDGAVMERPDTRTPHRDQVRHPDPGSGRIRWTLPWRLDKGRPRKGTGGEILVLYDSDQPYVVGADVDKGVPRWRYQVPGGDIPVAVHATGRHVVVCSFPADRNRHQPYVSHSPRPPILLASPPAMAVTVLDIATGTARWSHRWPWPEPLGGLASVEAMTVAGEVVATQEGDSLCARRIDDGALLWSQPAAPLSTRSAELRSRLPVPLSFRGTTRRSAWIWLQDFHGSVGDGTATTANTFIEPLTGKSVRLADVFHLSDDGLALARSGATLTCQELPVP